jgi:steroid 5-alpha reductase family enzyme
MDLLLRIFIANALATVFVWIVGIFLKSASIYDPYWSVQTVVIYMFLMISKSAYNLGSILILCCLLFWAVRLTYNFAYGFDDLSYVDWRYKMLKEKTGPLFQLVSLLGIHMFPTIVVYLASIPAYMYLIRGFDFEAVNLVGLFIMVIATILELISDLNMAKFKKIRTDRNQVINVGLWKYSRHPNYLGEIMFWYGLALVYVLSDLSSFNCLLGAIVNHLMFLFISIPMAENHMKGYKPNFMEYKNKTRMLLPFKK